MKKYRIQERIRTGNGTPFSLVGGWGISKLSITWILCGITHERIEPDKPTKWPARKRAADNERPRSIVTIYMAAKIFDDFLLRSKIRQSRFSRDEFYGATAFRRDDGDL